MERAEARAKELVESKDATVEIFGGNEDELVELSDTADADADDNCDACEDDEE